MMKASVITWRYYRAARGQLNAVLDEEARPDSGPYDKRESLKAKPEK
jgi:hypothetical protein